MRPWLHKVQDGALQVVVAAQWRERSGLRGPKVMTRRWEEVETCCRAPGPFGNCSSITAAAMRSGGERQRMALASAAHSFQRVQSSEAFFVCSLFCLPGALIRESPILLLDEPTSLPQMSMPCILQKFRSTSQGDASTSHRDLSSHMSLRIPCLSQTS